MGLAWSTTDTVNANQGVKILCYAESGAGKTVLCATAPRPAIISAESGLLSLNPQNLDALSARGAFGPGAQLTKNIPVLTISNVQQLVEAYHYFANPANGARQHFSTICIDSITEIGEVVLRNAKMQVKDPRQAYGELIEKMQDTIKLFRDLPGYNVYVAAKMEPVKDEASGTVKYGPSMPGSKMGPALPYYFDEVFHLGINKTQQGDKYRFIRTDGDLQYIAKDRSGTLAEMEAPNLTNIFNKIQQGVKA